MAIANGTYILVSAKTTTKAIDVSANSDAKGANVQLWSKNGKSGQYVTVTGEYPKQVLRFPLTGKAVTVNGTAKNGQNIVQTSGNGSDAQAWKIDESGTATVDGTSYTACIIRSALNNSLVLGLKNSATADGTNVQLATYSSSNLAHKWALVPVPLLPKGNYRLISSLDTKVCVSSIGRQDGSNVQAAGVDLEDNKQVWTFNGSTTATNIINQYSQCYLNADGTSAGSNVNQHKGVNGAYTAWLLTTTGSMKYNGATYPLVTIRSQAGSGTGSDNCLDVGKDEDKIQTDVRVYNYHSRKGQKFLAIPTVPLASQGDIPTPTALGCAYSKGGARYTGIWGNGTTKAYLCWISTMQKFQVRGRWRARKATSGDEEFGAWSAWSFNGSTANDGWGDVMKANCTPTSQKDPKGTTRKYGNMVQFTLSTTGNDLVEYQYQVRAVKINGGMGDRRGAIANGKVTFKYKPTFTATSFSWSPSGIKIGYRSDQRRNNNDLVIYSVKCVHNGVTKTIYNGGEDGYPINDIPWNGTAILPTSKVSFIPSVNDSITAVVRFTNVDGAYKVAKQTITGTVTEDGNKNLVMNPTWEVTSGNMLHVTAGVSDADKYQLWIDYGDDGGGYSKYNDVDGEWYVPVLFNKPYRAYVIAEKGGKWNIADRLEPKIDNSSSYWFNFVNSSGNQDWAQIIYNSDSAPAIQRSIAYDSNIQLTSGNTLEVVHFGYGRSESVKIGGVMPLTFRVPNSTVSKFEALGNAHYAWFRAANISSAYRVAVTNIDFDMTDPQFTQVSLSLTRINNPTDW